MDSSDTKTLAQFDEGNSFFNIIKRFIKNIATVSTIYLFGYFDLSIAWLVAPVLLNAFRQEWKKSSDRKRQSVKLAVQDEKNVILAQLSDLPAWVYFPDIERAEWVNKMLIQLWPNVNTYLRDMIKSTIEPKIQETLTLYKMTGFQFDRLRFGTIPPRIGGIKVYDKQLSRTEIMMDIDLIYAGDCDISFYLKGLSGGIKDFQIHGMVRIIMKPLIPAIPFIGGIQVFFLNKPIIDFNLVGAADILDIPGVSDVLRKVIVDQISAMMVLPNKLPIVLSEMVPAATVKTPDPEGVLRVQVVQAIKLMKKDVGIIGKGKSDPYIIVTMGAQEHRSKTIDNTVNPKWDFWCEFLISQRLDQHLRIDVFDKDDGSKYDDKLGKATLKLNDVLDIGEIDTWVSLEEVKHGMVHLRLTWYQLTSDSADVKPAIEELDKLRVPGISSCILIIYLDSVQNLPDARANKRPDPVVSITAGHETKSTGVQFKTSSPVYEQGFTFLIHNPQTDSFTLKITDQKSGQDLGSMMYSLNKLIAKQNLKQEIEPFSLLKSGHNTKVLFSAQLKILKKSPTKKDVPNFVFNSTIPNATPPSTPDSVTASTEVTETGKSTDKDFKDDILDKNGDSINNDEKSVTGSLMEEEVSWESYKPQEVSNSCQWINDQLEQSKPPSKTGSIKGSLRRRNTSQSETAKKLGNIEMTLNFVPERQRLVVIIHRLADLPIKDPTDLPDPYVKIYMLPKTKETKRKTKVIKDTCNPVYEEVFEYVISSDEIPLRQLRVSVISQKSSFMNRSSDMGQVTLELKDVDLNNHKAWYALEPETD
ncbi:extended synaptotagmin-2-A isoform X2 [Planococcus citri]|uniref:extended synaptotagmin-2-A isoform X2 n=1 Tax=Planococcus citri TaxID=170843 RepID=UPI0031F80CA4